MSTLLLATHVMGALEERVPRNPVGSQRTIIIAPGIPAIKKWLATSILADEFIDLTKKAPAKGRSKPLNRGLEGQIVLLHAAEYFQAKRLIPDMASWLQCYAIFMVVVITKHPERATSMIIYMYRVININGHRGYVR